MSSLSHVGQKCYLPIFRKPLILKGYGAVKKLIMGAAPPFGANGALKNRNVVVRRRRTIYRATDGNLGTIVLKNEGVHVENVRKIVLKATYHPEYASRAPLAIHGEMRETAACGAENSPDLHRGAVGLKVVVAQNLTTAVVKSEGVSVENLTPIGVKTSCHAKNLRPIGLKNDGSPDGETLPITVEAQRSSVTAHILSCGAKSQHPYAICIQRPATLRRMTRFALRRETGGAFGNGIYHAATENLATIVATWGGVSVENLTPIGAKTTCCAKNLTTVVVKNDGLSDGETLPIGAEVQRSSVPFYRASLSLADQEKPDAACKSLILKGGASAGAQMYSWRGALGS